MKKTAAWIKMAVVAAVFAALLACVPAFALAEDTDAVEGTPGVASSEDLGAREEVGSDNLVPVTADMLPEGTYDISVITDSSMFKVTKCELTVKDGQMSAVFTLSGTGYERIFMGTGEEALAADPSEYAEAVEDADGAYTYTVSIPAVNQRLDCTAFSHRKQQWYDHTIMLDPATLPEGTIKAAAWAAPAGKPFLADSAYTDLEDGIYTMEVELEGGTGKAHVTSPAYIKVENGHPVVSLEWSSQNYDYMVLNGELYEPVKRDDKNYFELPIMVFDEPMDVIADTTAMSEPHEIAYKLTFKSDTAELQSSGIHISTQSLAFMVVIIVFVIAVLFLSRMRNARKGR